MVAGCASDSFGEASGGVDEHCDHRIQMPAWKMKPLEHLLPLDEVPGFQPGVGLQADSQQGLARSAVRGHERLSLYVRLADCLQVPSDFTYLLLSAVVPYRVAELKRGRIGLAGEGGEGARRQKEDVAGGGK